MAKLNSFSLMAAFLFYTIVMISNTSAYTEEILEVHISPGAEENSYTFAPEEADIDDEYDDDFAYPPEPDYIEFLRDCTKKITKDCSEDIFVYMFDENVTVNKTCCDQLVNMGETCHTALVKNVFSTSSYKANAILGISRSKQLWNKCAVIVGGDESASPIPFEY